MVVVPFAVRLHACGVKVLVITDDVLVVNIPKFPDSSPCLEQPDEPVVPLLRVCFLPILSDSGPLIAELKEAYLVNVSFRVCFGT